jgi:hypothetical protein
MRTPTDFTTDGIDGDPFDTPLFDVGAIPRNLSQKFVAPPFSILFGDNGQWQKRRRDWKALGIRSEEGRDVRAYGSDNDTSDLGRHIESISGGQSIFDPVLTELSYRWFCPPGGRILDPFAGGSVRGVVAAYLGYHYEGIDLSERQIAANLRNLDEIIEQERAFPGSAYWTYGDSLVEVVGLPQRYDYVFSCPPYYDLEVYSDGPGDISAMSWEDFLTAYRAIIAASVGKLRDDRFCTFVVSEIRNKKTGMYRNFVGETVEAFEAAGANFYCDTIFATPVGSVAQMAERQFRSSRKIARRHQNILTFVKGDPRVVSDMIEGAQ